MKTAHFFVDVPGELIELVNEINYANVSEAQGRMFLQQLDELADKHDIPRRRQPTQTVSYNVHSHVPDEAIKAINARDFSKVSKLAIKMAKPFIRQKLKSMGLI